MEEKELSPIGKAKANLKGVVEHMKGIPHSPNDDVWQAINKAEKSMGFLQRIEPDPVAVAPEPEVAKEKEPDKKPAKKTTKKGKK